MAAPYWGQLPPPAVVRGRSLRHGNVQGQTGKNDLVVDTSMAGDRSVFPSESEKQRQSRYSTQTDAPTISTQSPFASPIASEFRGDGLAPRPPSYPYNASDASYDRDYLEKRRRRESRNKEPAFDDPSFIPPPAAPDAPRIPPPTSYKQPYSNGSPSNYPPTRRSRSTRKSEGPISPGRDPPEEYYRTVTLSQPADEKLIRSGNGGSLKGKEVVRQRPERLDSAQSYQRKGLSASEAEPRREWAADRSPLQRLELTLDSITKEEKRARVEEAELLAREAKAGRGGGKAAQNSVRFRNRPVVKAELGSQPQSQPLSSSEGGVVRNLDTKEKESLQRGRTVDDEKTPINTENIHSATKGRGSDYQPK